MPEQLSRLIRFNLDVTDEAVLAAVRSWVELLAAEEYDQALAVVYAPDWDRDRLIRTIKGCGVPEPPWLANKITSLSTARFRPGDDPARRLYQDVQNEDAIAVANARDLAIPDFIPHKYVYLDLPHDGFWSDLTLEMNVVNLGNQFVLALDNIHVM